MISASLAMGGIVAHANVDDVGKLRVLGQHLGLAFQIVDDILDATADTATLGKTAGKDAKADKTTYVKLYGLEASRELARRESDAALATLANLPGDKLFLATLVQQMAARTN
jgi:geranylgeranyl pyrophosphate synthase